MIKPCEHCGKRPGTTNSHYEPWGGVEREEAGGGDWVCWVCEEQLGIEYEYWCPCGCTVPERCVYYTAPLAGAEEKEKSDFEKAIEEAIEGTKTEEKKQ